MAAVVGNANDGDITMDDCKSLHRKQCTSIWLKIEMVIRNETVAPSNRSEVEQRASFMPGFV